MTRPDWIAVDWGTTNLRIWMMDAQGGVLDTRETDDGMGRTARDGFEPALLRALGTDVDGKVGVPVIVCGMAGSRQGWCEAPYAAAPCVPPGAAQAVRVPGTDPRIAVHILPGVKQDKPADVMRGEETQIAGFLARQPGFDGVLCLPGTHTKWARISAGEIVSFQTCMTGEMFSLLSQHSVLRHSVGTGWDDAAFAEAVSDGMSHPATLAARLFGLRAEALLHGLDGDVARARLSGLLIGAELAATRPYWLGERVAVIGAEALSQAYVAGLAAQGALVEAVDGAGLTLDGLKAARAGLKEVV